MGKAEKIVHFPATIVLCDINIQSVSIPLNSRGQGHFSAFWLEYFKKLLGLVALL